MGNLWSVDKGGDSWIGSMDNPSVILANPPKKGRKGHHPRKGVMPPALARYWATHRRGARRNPPAAVSARRLPAGTVTWIKAGAKKAKRRASGFRSKFPAAAAILGVSSGFISGQLLAGFLNTSLPVSITGSAPGKWGIKAAAAVLPGLLIRKFISGSMGLSVMIGGIVSLVLEVVKPYLGLGSQPMLGYYASGMIARALPPGGGLRGLGQYTSAGGAYPVSNAPPRMIATTPDRLSPRARF